MRRSSRIAVVALALHWVIAAMTMGTAAATTVDEAGLSVTAGYGGRVSTAAWLPVEVRIDPLRAIRGTLTVRTNGQGGPAAARREVEVTPGSPKVFRFLMPAGAVATQLTGPDAGPEPLEVRTRLDMDGRTYQAGMLGEVPPDAPPLRSEPTGMTGAWVGVDPGWLELSAAALAPLGALVASQDDLAALSPQAARNLAAGVVAGTDLVVVGGGGIEVGGLAIPPLGGSEPDRWSLTAGDVAGDAGADVLATAATAGRARVVTTAVRPGNPGAGRSGALWSSLAQPGGRPDSSQSEWTVDRLGFQFGRLLLDTGGGSVPALPWLAGFTLAYVVVVGPVNALLLGWMRRRELAWATVPLVTLVFTVAAFASVSGARPPVGLSTSVATWIDGIGTETAVVGARAPRESAQEILLPGAGWTVRPLMQSRQVATLETRPDGIRTSFELAALQLGGVIAERSLDRAAPLQLDVRAGPGGLMVTVVNVGSRPIQGIALRAATASRRIGDLAPGAQKTVELAGERIPVVPPHRDLFEGLAGGPPAGAEAVLRTTVMDGAPGLVWAIGQVAESDTGVRVNGARAHDQGGLVAVAVTPRGGGAVALSPFAVHRDLIAGENTHRPGPLAVQGASEAFLRFRLPADAVGGVLGSQLERTLPGLGPQAELSVWEPATRQWLALGEAFPGGSGDPARLVSPLGELWVRASGSLSPFDFSGRALAAPGQLGPGQLGEGQS